MYLNDFIHLQRTCLIENAAQLNWLLNERRESQMQPDPCLLKRIEQLELEAKKFGFYWENFSQLIEQVQSECREVQEAWQLNEPLLLQEEIGDLIQAAISLAVFCHLDPHETLLKSIEKFQGRYDAVVEMARNDGHESLQKQSFEILMNYWKRAKSQMKNK